MKQLALDGAKKAGGVLLEGYSPLGAAKLKGRGHLVTKYDLESERIIIEEIRKKHPDHNILAEESGFAGRGSPYTWIIDPLDGTGNFTRGNPFFSISIALSYQKELLLGLVYVPVLNELYVAEKGRGAYLNDEPISVSPKGEVGTSFFVACEGSEQDISRYVRLYSNIRPLSSEFRKLGSAAIECSWVASGRAEGYVTTKINPWDIAAGILLVEEAGGRVTDFEGKKWNFEQSDIIASNGKVHERLLGLVNDALLNSF